MSASSETNRTILQGGHVIDPANGVNKITDVAIANGKISSVGDILAEEGDEVIDMKGLHVSPGFVDIHIHAYGTLGFADPDSLGIWQGVTSFVDAGGPGIGTLDEFLALMSGRTVTDLYVGLYLRPMGLIGVNFIEGEAKTLMDVPIAQWMDLGEAHRDVFRYLKLGAFGNYGTGPIKIGKGLAEVLDVPIYVHIGEFQVSPDQITTADAFAIAGKGDIITHIYHGNAGSTLGEDGKVLPEVRDAERRGVLFDIGFGGYNFSWRVAERAYAQDLVPHVISSDLQQHNVGGPVYSLANVMTVFLRLGMTLEQVIERVTINAARAISLEDRAGSLRPGAPADVTVFRLEPGEVELRDCQLVARTADEKIVPRMAFKNGTRYDSDLTRCNDERNWFWQISENAVPEAADGLDTRQREFLGALASALDSIEWQIESAERLDVFKATILQNRFHEVRARMGIPLKEALEAVFSSFLLHPFTMQIGLFLFRIDKPLVLERLRDVAAARHTTLRQIDLAVREGLGRGTSAAPG